MSRECAITGTRLQFGNNVSHSNRKTRRTFLPNIKKLDVWSDALKEKVRINISARGIRTLEHNGGLDAFLLGSSNSKLTACARRIKARIEKVAAKKQ